MGEGSAKREFCEAWVVALREKGELPSVKGGEKAEGEVRLVQEEFPGGRIEEEVVSMKAECYAYIQVEKGGDFPWTSTMPSSVITLKVAREER